MAVKRTWVTLWFAITIPIIFWDAGYCFMRPRSMEGGDLHFLWKPYAIYQNVDLVYGLPALREGNGFTNAQSLLNLVENALNILYLYLAHVVDWPASNLVAFTSVSLTLSKTVLYWAQEYYCGYCAVGHNSLRDLIQYWIIPNGIWLVVPSMIVFTLGKEIAGQLNLADDLQRKVKTK
ncbi:hypothetical protein C8J56DRAFT_222209 [Mycena floridula]|nr:hypothetical protein C8J56DRAFT_222209 [Mycena floridula]